MSLGWRARARVIFKIVAMTVALASMLALPACWVESINALYDDGFMRQDADVIMDQKLVGDWSAVEENCMMVLAISAKDRAYLIESTQQGEKCSDAGKKERHQAHLIKLGAHYFLDVSPRDDDVCEMCLAKHTIYRTEIDKSSFSLIPIDSDWLKDAVRNKTVLLSTLPNDTDVLTSPSAELKTFCRKYADDPAVFKPIGLVFKRK